MQGGLKELEYSMWVDDQDLPRKMATVIETPQGKVSTTGTYRGWGEPVEVSAPPARQVFTPRPAAATQG